MYIWPHIKNIFIILDIFYIYDTADPFPIMVNAIMKHGIKVENLYNGDTSVEGLRVGIKGTMLNNEILLPY